MKLAGRERLSVRYRDGYFEPEPLELDAHRCEAGLRQGVWSPVDASAIKLSGSVSPVSGPGDHELKLNIGLAAVSLLPGGDRWNGQIEVSLFSTGQLRQYIRTAYAGARAEAAAGQLRQGG